MRVGIDMAVAKALADFATAYRRPIVDAAETLRVWIEAMSGAFLTPEDIAAGATTLLQREDRFPSPAKLREYAMDERARRVRALDDGVLRAEPDAEVCPLCGAVGLWERHGIAPEAGTPGTRLYRPARPYTRFEDWHHAACPRRSPDQPPGPRPEAKWQIPADPLERRRRAAPLAPNDAPEAR